VLIERLFLPPPASDDPVTHDPVTPEPVTE
jgi:hypothetical protein